MRDALILDAVFNRPWAIMPSTFASLKMIVRRHMRGERLSAEEVGQRIGSAKREQAARAEAKSGVNSGGVIAVIPIHGIIDHRARMVEDSSSGVGTSTELVGRYFDAAVADSNVGAILLDVDSPGGSVAGVQELSDKIYAARGTKPIVASANDLMASAALWIGSAADEITVTPSGLVGSVGVIAEHVDFSKSLEQEGIKPTLITSSPFKAEGNPYEPLGDEARAEIQRQVDLYHGEFVGALARNRSLPAAMVEANFGKGRVMKADEAARAGMVDRVESFEQTVARMIGAAAPQPDGSVQIRQLRSQARARDMRIAALAE